MEDKYGVAIPNLKKVEYPDSCSTCGFRILMFASDYGDKHLCLFHGHEFSDKGMICDDWHKQVPIANRSCGNCGNFTEYGKRCGGGKICHSVDDGYNCGRVCWKINVDLARDNKY